MKARKLILSALLCLALSFTGCTDKWVSIALADLPIVTQMAINLGSLAYTLQSGNQLSPEETNAIYHLRDEAKADLELLNKFYQDYKTNPGNSTIAQINNAITQISNNLPGLLNAAHIKDSALSSRVGAAVSLILATVSSFAALVPNDKLAARTGTYAAAAPPPTPKDLKAQWNQAIAAPTTSNAALNAALLGAQIK